MAHDGNMQIPQSVARFNRRVTNPIQRLWAGRAPTFGILEHVAERFGALAIRAHRTRIDHFAGVSAIGVLRPDQLEHVNVSIVSVMRFAGRPHFGQVVS